jgi:hypothetical protein
LNFGPCPSIGGIIIVDDVVVRDPGDLHLRSWTQMFPPRDPRCLAGRILGHFGTDTHEGPMIEDTLQQPLLKGSHK